MDDRPLDLSNKAVFSTKGTQRLLSSKQIEFAKGAKPPTPAKYVSSQCELSKPVEKNRYAAEQDKTKFVRYHQINRKNEEGKHQGSAKDEKQINVVEKFSSYAHGGSGQIQGAENNSEPDILKSIQEYTAIRVSVIKSPIKSIRNVVKDKTATDEPSSNSGSQRHKDSDSCTIRLIQDDLKINIHQNCDTDEHRNCTSTDLSTSFFSSLPSPAKSISSHGEPSQSLESNSKETKEESVKSTYSHLLNNGNKTLVFGDMIPGSCDMIKKKMSKESATNSADKNHKSACNINHKDKPRKLEDPDISDIQVAKEDFFSPRPSTSAGASCSYDSPVTRGQTRDSSSKGPVSCKYCSKKVALSKMKRHVRTHTGEKPFECKHCDKKFSRNDNLQVHIRSHSGDRPFLCQECNKAFKASFDLQVHNRIHTGETPYVCPFCGRAFNQISNMNRHKEICKKKPKEK